MSEQDDFKEKCDAHWQLAIQSAFGNAPAQTFQTSDPSRMVQILTPFLAPSRVHAMMPESGGLDVVSVEISAEKGCLEFAFSERSAMVFKSQALSFEYIASAPEESFFCLDLEELEQSGVYDNRRRRYEQLMETAPRSQDYMNFSLWDQGFMGYDTSGSEIPLPPEARIVHRALDGRVMLVSSTSIWNRNPGTYDARHEKMSNQEIREILEKVIARRPS